MRRGEGVIGVIGADSMISCYHVIMRSRSLSILLKKANQLTPSHSTYAHESGGLITTLPKYQCIIPIELLQHLLPSESALNLKNQELDTVGKQFILKVRANAGDPPLSAVKLSQS